ncbi:MAG TPA: prepilin-type N-terminal cleavage/methylation domain-containing protein [bacterium]|nr:prepilin-type N-terminal cleavage/methylation domain-containing protein [bacterium]
MKKKKQMVSSENPVNPVNPVPEFSERITGFTLIEMMIVVMVIGIIAAIVVPRLGVLDMVQLRSSARTLAGTIRLTYATAVVNRQPYRICFDLEGQSYRIQQKSGDEYVDAPDPLLTPRVLPEPVVIKRVQVMDRLCEGYCQECLYFTPGGYVEDAAIYLGLENDDPVFTVFTRPMTGRAVIVPEEMSREDWEKSDSN